jgi:membrane protein
VASTPRLPPRRLTPPEPAASRPNVIDRAYDAVEARIMAVRRRSPSFDHLCRALLRYDEVLGGRLAAAIAYYGFFAVFALVLIGYAVFGLLVKANINLFEVVQRFLGQNLPFLDVQAILDSGRTIGVVGLIGLIFTGVGWVEAIRSSQRLIWRLNQQPGYIGIRQVVDLLVLVGILLLVASSVFAVAALESFLDWAADGRASFVLAVVSWALTIGINMLLAAALLVAVPRLRMTIRRLVPPVLMVGIGITLLNTVGRTFVAYVQRNPAYALVGGAVGVLVYLYVFNQLLLFGAAWAATSPHGRVIDISADDKTAPVGQNAWIRDDRPG